MFVFFILQITLKMNTPLVPFQAGSPIMIAGPTGSGKTFWTNKLLKNQMFTEPVTSVLYCYGVYQTFYNKMEIPNLELHEGLPSLDKVQSLNDGKFHVIVLDDLMEYIVKSVETQNLFTKYCHHFNITAIFLTQNVFAQGPCSRTISINTHILVLFVAFWVTNPCRITRKEFLMKQTKMYVCTLEEFILVDVVTLLYMDELNKHWKCCSLYTIATMDEKG